MNIGNKAFYLFICLGTVLLAPVEMISCRSRPGNNQESMTNKSENMKGFTTNIEKAARDNKDFRRVLYTSKHMQLVLMSLKPKEEIGAEVHSGTDQFFRIEGGHGICKINDNTYNVSDGDVIIVPAGARHNVINTDSALDLKLYTLYAPPEHKDGIIRATKPEAEANKEEFDGKTTE